MVQTLSPAVVSGATPSSFIGTMFGDQLPKASWLPTIDTTPVPAGGGGSWMLEYVLSGMSVPVASTSRMTFTSLLGSAKTICVPRFGAVSTTTPSSMATMAISSGSPRLIPRSVKSTLSSMSAPPSAGPPTSTVFATVSQPPLPSAFCSVTAGALPEKSMATRRAGPPDWNAMVSPSAVVVLNGSVVTTGVPPEVSVVCALA